MGIGQPSLGGIAARPGIVGAQQALLDQLGGEDLAHRRVFVNRLVHLRLGVGGLVRLVVAEAPVADQVDDDVAAELLAEGGGEPDRADAGGDVVGIDMDDRQVEALGNVRGVASGAALLGVGGETQLVVRDHVQGAAGGVALELGQVEDLGHHALRRKRGVAMNQDRDGAGPIEVRLRSFSPRLLGAAPALDDRIDRFQVAGVGK